MKKNKEIKVGDKIWLNTYHIKRDSYYTVKSVKKDKTLVKVVIEAERYNRKPYEIVMYGHASSSILSGYDRMYGHLDYTYTCDYSIIEDLTTTWDTEYLYREAGKALIRVAKYLK